jgi:hypothetical protein
MILNITNQASARVHDPHLVVVKSHLAADVGPGSTTDAKGSFPKLEVCETQFDQFVDDHICVEYEGIQESDLGLTEVCAS